MKLPFKLIDYIIILIAAGFVVISIYSAYIRPVGTTHILIQGQNTEWIYNVESEETVVVDGPIGETVVRVSEGYAWVESSPCDNQNCVAQGFVKKPGRWAACLPNQVLVMIETRGEGDNEVDAISR